MNILIYVLAIVYFLAINFYGVFMLILQKRQIDRDEKVDIKDGKILLSGLLGGALGIFICMFIIKHHLRDLYMMVVMPLFATLSIFLLYMLFSGGFRII
ncbi:MAG: hypothetical protein E7342_01585 [Clostridiales bacterium]|nr:hypothetical protein [Clostridiales bacterium]